MFRLGSTFSGGTRTATLFLALAIFTAAGCTSSPAQKAAESLTFIVVRHAEKATDDSRDPSLTATGQARAIALQQRLQDTPLRAVYSSDFKRTRDTGLPSAQAQGLELKLYDARLPAPALAQQLKQENPSGVVLVVGHSNTVPDIVAALCACTPAAMDETEYDRYSSVRISADGKATLSVNSYGAPSQSP